MALQQHESVSPRVVVLEQIEKIGHVAKALRHLLALGVDHESVMHPVARELTAEGHGLRAFVLVMRELQIHAAAMQIETFAEQFETHHDAFAVPTGSAVTPGRWP